MFKRNNHGQRNVHTIEKMKKLAFFTLLLLIIGYSIWRFGDMQLQATVLTWTILAILLINLNKK